MATLFFLATCQLAFGIMVRRCKNQEKSSQISPKRKRVES